MSSVDIIMLRSEAPWFLRFLAICQCKLKYCMNPNEEDYEWMQRVAECDSKWQVQNVLKEYNQPDFTDWIHPIQETARKIVIIENGLRARGAVLL